MNKAMAENKTYITSAEHKGRQEGRQEGEYILLILLLERKFHHIPDVYRDKIIHADSETLLAWGGRMLDAKTLAEIFE